MFGLVNLVVEAVEHEIHQIRYYRFGTFCLQQIHQMIVGCRCKLNKDFPYDTYPGLLYIQCFNLIKICNDITTQMLEFPKRRMGGFQKFTAYIVPFLMYPIGFTRVLFIRTHAINASHENIPEGNAIGNTNQQVHINLKSRVLFHFVQVHRYHRYIVHTFLFQGSSDKANIVGSTTSTAGLGHQNGGFCQVIFAGK